MTNLSDQQINFYNDKGYVAPIDVLSIQEANEIREEIELIEKKWPNALEGLGRNYVHMISPIFNKVCLNNKILDAVKSIMQYPILGIGIGNWKIKSIEYAGVDVNGYTVPYHTHNDFLQISAEIGVIGGIIYLMIYLIPIYQVLIKLKNRVLDNLNLVYLLIISSIFIDSMLNFPIARPVNHIFLLFTLVAMTQTSKANLNNESI